jgi:hypothetical protein
VIAREAAMSALPRAFLLIAALALLAGCATPRYETIHRYEPPAGGQGQACLKGCEDSLNSCRAECKAAWQACTQGVEAQVDERYAQALKAYAQDLRQYRRELEQYQWDLWLDWGNGYDGLWYSPWPYRPWPGYYPAYFPPSNPPGDPPTREGVRAALQDSHCRDDCGCLAKHDACFERCGGRVVTETRCVANCPAGK